MGGCFAPKELWYLFMNYLGVFTVGMWMQNNSVMKEVDVMTCVMVSFGVLGKLGKQCET